MSERFQSEQTRSAVPAEELQPRAPFAILPVGAAVTALGLAALLGWLLDLPHLAGFDTELVPMAPSTALLFLAFGGALCLRARPPLDSPAHRLGARIGDLAAGVALALLVLGALGIRLPVERLGLTLSCNPGVPVGHMSPVTAVCFLLAACAARSSAGTPATGTWRGLLGFGAAAVLLGIAFVFVLGYLYGRPLLYGGKTIPMALSTAVGLMVLGLGLLLLAGRRGGGSLELHERTVASGWLFLVFALLAAGLIAAGHLYCNGYERQHRVEVERALSAVADLKVSGLTQWRRERLGDGSAFLGNESFAELVEQTLERPSDPRLRNRLQTWLRQVRGAHGYQTVFLLDVGGAALAADPAALESVPARLREAVADSLRLGEVSFLDFHRDHAEGPVHLAVLVPIYAAQPERRPLGVLVLRIDPAAHLYPLVQGWPTPSPSAEALLVRREGDHVLYLNELRFDPGAALTLRQPLASPRLAAAKAISGYEGIVEGPDYRGLLSLAAVRRVPDSPWFLVARIDAAEVDAGLVERVWHLALLVSALLAAAACALGWGWRQHLGRFSRERFRAAESLRSSEARYQTLLENAPVAVLIKRADRITEVNMASLPLFAAQSKEQLLNRSPFELFHPDDHPAMRARIGAMLEHGDAVPVREGKVLRLDGAAVDVEVTAAPFWDQGGPAIHVVLRDVTERKRAEQALRASETELRQRHDELTRFTYTVSHDLKSPLVTIQTFVGYLEEDLANNDRPGIDKDLGFIRNAAQKMSRLLDELLMLSRVGRYVNPAEELSLQEIVRESLSLVAGQIAERGAKVELTDAPLVLRGDRDRLIQAFQNLVDNAVKFMGEQPEPRIEIGIEGSQDEPVVFVRDNGMGIDARHISKVFDLFAQLDPQRGGTGIGLPLVRRIVETHGGRISVQSEGPGRGSCFRITLAGARRASKERAS